MTTPLVLDGNSLSLSDIRDVSARNRPVGLAPEALEHVTKARDLVDRIAAGDEPAYGINTGFGTLAEVRIEKKDLQQLQRNLILSHAAGVGQPLSIPEARALLLLRCNVLAKGFSGVRPSTLRLGLEMLNRGVTPVVPARGSVGASGDLAPLAHLALVFIGEGEAFGELIAADGHGVSLAERATSLRPSLLHRGSP
jgi:histidine ammonia-lyase